MRANSKPINFFHRTTNGVLFDTVIQPGDAEIAEDGLILSCSFISEDNIFGVHIMLDQGRSSSEVRVRKILSLLASIGITVVENEIIKTKTKQSLKWEYGALLGGANKALFEWIDRGVPNLTKEEYGYFDHKGRLMFEGPIHVKGEW